MLFAVWLAAFLIFGTLGKALKRAAQRQWASHRVAKQLYVLIFFMLYSATAAGWAWVLVGMGGSLGNILAMACVIIVIGSYLRTDWDAQSTHFTRIAEWQDSSTSQRSQPLNHETFDLRKAIFLAEGIDFPIAGGTGLSRDDAIVFTEKDHDKAVHYERPILQAPCVFYGFWKPRRKAQRMIEANGRVYDAHTFECEDDGSKLREVELWFDISLPQSNIHKMPEEFLTREELEARRTYKFEKGRETPRFHAAVHLALSRKRAFRKKQTVSVKDIQAMLEVDEESARQIIKGLRECGAPDPAAKKLLEQYSAQHKSSSPA